MYKTLIGKQRCLVFPVGCNANVHLPFADNIPDYLDDDDVSNDEHFGIWGHTGSFTISSILTPYDVNGYGTEVTGSSLGSVLDSDKTLPVIHTDESSPANREMEQYLSKANRSGYTMRVFQSDNATIDLVNTATHTQNQPAEYKIKFSVTINGSTVSVESDTVIKANAVNVPYDSTLEERGFEDNKWAYQKVGGGYGTTITGGVASTSFTTNEADYGAKYFVNQELFVDDGGFVSIGNILSIVNVGAITTITMGDTIPLDITGEVLYSHSNKEATYLDGLCAISCSFKQNSREMSIFYNNMRVKVGNHTINDTFSFGRGDMYIGANGSNVTQATNTSVSNNQFMGEFHELAVSNITPKNFQSRFTLSPRYDNLLLYLLFEEVDV